MKTRTLLAAGLFALSAPAIVKTLVSLGADVEAVIPEEPSLEEVYLHLLRDRGSDTA